MVDIGTVGDRPAEPSGAAVARPRRIWLTVRVLAELLLALGVLVLFFIAYQLVGVPAEEMHAQQRLGNQLEQSWHTPNQDSHGGDRHPGSAAAPAPADGQPFARLYLPRLGLNWAVVEGVSRADLRLGPGHYPGTVMPGQIGNFAVAGHRIRGVFIDLDQIESGDAVILETTDTWFTYRVYQTETVLPNDMAVLAPVPDQPDAAPIGAHLTLTTCAPLGRNNHRLVVHADLVGVRTKP